MSSVPRALTGLNDTPEAILKKINDFNVGSSHLVYVCDRRGGP